ncbi:MarR family transcriptional regulator, partial [Clavibacter michiganensis subsp. insidiosus]
ALTPSGRAGIEADDAEGGSRLIRGLGGWTRADLDAFAGYLARLNAGAGAGTDADPRAATGLADGDADADTAAAVHAA